MVNIIETKYIYRSNIDCRNGIAIRPNDNFCRESTTKKNML